MSTPVYRYTVTPVQRNTGTLASWYTAHCFIVHMCTPNLWYTCVTVRWDIGVVGYRFPGTRIYGYTKTSSTVMAWYRSTLYSNTLPSRGRGTWVHQHTGNSYSNVLV